MPAPGRSMQAKGNNIAGNDHASTLPCGWQCPGRPRDFVLFLPPSAGVSRRPLNQFHMAQFKPFRGIRPLPEHAARVACRPYDVLNAAEARAEAGDNPHSFYHVIKPEIDFPDDQDAYAPAIYRKGKENFDQMKEQGIFRQDPQQCFYIYAQIMDGRTQYGIVGCASVDDYFNNVILKHELTRPDKEEDRKNHVRTSNLNYEPVFFAYPHREGIDRLVAEAVKADPEYDFEADDGIRHMFWVVSGQAATDRIAAEFKSIPHTYVADGHHRTAAAALVGKERREANENHTGQEEYNYFLAVLFPDNQLSIMDYNRVIRDLNGMSPAEFLERLGSRFAVEEMGAKAWRPSHLHEFSMYLDGKWYKLTANDGTFDDHDPIGVLDVTILSEQVLAPLLDIVDLRKDKRIDFVGGLRGLDELKKRVDSGEMKVAFALYPVSMEQLIAIADSGKIMPPKTTWFEPKLRSGLVLHALD